MFDSYELALMGFCGISTVVAFFYSLARGTNSADRLTHRLFGIAIGFVGLTSVLRGFKIMPTRQLAMFGAIAIVGCAIAMVVNAERSRRRYHSPS